MLEQEYCDLSDLQMCRLILGMMKTMNAFEEPNTKLRNDIMDNLRLMVKDLEPKVSAAMEIE